jgi:hypothetical protein
LTYSPQVHTNPAVPEASADACAQYSIGWAAQTEQPEPVTLKQAMPGIPDEADVLVLYADTPY